MRPAQHFIHQDPETINVSLRKLEPNHTFDLFNRAVEEGTAGRVQNIGAAIAASGVAAEAIDNLVGESREEIYNSLSILYVMAKTGEVEPLVKAIEEHKNDEVRRAVVKLLNLSGQAEVADAALQRHVLGVPTLEQNRPAEEPESPDTRMATESEIKQVTQGTRKQEAPVKSKKELDDVTKQEHQASIKPESGGITKQGAPSIKRPEPSGINKKKSFWKSLWDS